MSWRDEVKAGDLVIYQPGNIGGKKEIGKVERTTKTQIIIANPYGYADRPLRFNKKTGDSVGGQGYYRSWISEPTSEEIDAIRHRKARVKLRELLNKVDHRLTMHQIELIRLILEAADNDMQSPPAK